MSTSQGETGVLAVSWHKPAPRELIDRELPLIPTQEVPSCPVCEGDSAQLLAVGFDYELLTCRNSWRFVRCEACGHAWLNPRPEVSTLSTIYPSTYYAYNYESAVNPIARRAKEMLDGMKVGGILRYLSAIPRRYLDVGCGNGRFLKRMERHGMARRDLYGLELDADVVARLTREGYQVSCERVESCKDIPAQHFDLVTMFHVIEHVDDPAAVIERIATWLAPGGVFAIETPNLDSFDVRCFERGFWGGYHIPRHWHVFTPESLRRLLDKAGLETVAIRYQTGHSFWMYSMHHALRFGSPSFPRLARWFDPFGGLLPLLAAFTLFDKLRAALGFRTSSMLLLARKGPAAGG